MIVEDKHQRIGIKELIHDKDLKYILYGDPDRLEKNRVELDKILDFLRDEGLLKKMLYLVNFKGYVGFVHPIIKMKMEDERKANGLVIFADFKGVLRGFLKNGEKTISFIILDENKDIQTIFEVADVADIMNALHP
jgi:hypothetical protein